MSTSKSTAPTFTVEGPDDPYVVQPQEAPAKPAPQVTAGLPAPYNPAPSQSLEEFILPSGRAVRLRSVRTEEYLGAKERAAATAGDPTKNPDPRGARMTAALDREMLALVVVAYTDELDWTPTLDAQAATQLMAWGAATKELAPEARPEFKFVPDASGLLAALPETAWHATTPMELTIPGPRSLLSVFNGIADWEVLTSMAGRLLLPKRNLSAIVGKARTVSR